MYPTECPNSLPQTSLPLSFGPVERTILILGRLSRSFSVTPLCRRVVISVDGVRRMGVDDIYAAFNLSSADEDPRLATLKARLNPTSGSKIKRQIAPKTIGVFNIISNSSKKITLRYTNICL